MDAAAAPPRRPRHRWLVPILQVLLVLLAGAAAWFAAVRIYGPLNASPPLSEYECRMPDGSILKIEALTTGAKPTFSSTPPADDLRARLFGSQPQVLTGNSSTPQQIVVWMSRRDARTGAPLDFDWWAENVVVDAAGTEVSDADAEYPALTCFSPNGSSTRCGPPPLLADHASERNWLLRSRHPAFRPRGARLELNVKNTAGDVVASFDVPHPAPTPFPEWTAEPLPQTFTAGDLTVTVTGIRTGVDGGTYWARPDAEFRWQGRPTTDWEVSAVRFESPLGTTVSSEPTNLLRSGTAAARATSEDSSLLRERVWRMSLICVRNEEAPFTADERGRLAGVTIPAAHAGRDVEHSLAAGDCELQLVAAGGSGTSTVTLPAPRFGILPGSSTFGMGPFDQHASVKVTASSSGGVERVSFSSPVPWLLIDRAGVAADKAVSVRIHDDQGRLVPTHEEKPWDLSRDLFVLFFRPEPDATSLMLYATAQKPVVFEALVELPRPAAPSPTAPGKQSATHPASAP